MDAAQDLHRGGHVVPCRRGRPAQPGIRGDGAAQRPLRRLLISHDGRVLQTGQAAKLRFAGVLNDEQLFTAAARVFVAALAVGRQQDFVAHQVVEYRRQQEVALVVQVRHGVHAIGLARIAGNEDQFAIGGAMGAHCRKCSIFAGLLFS